MPNQGLERTNSLAVAVLHDEALCSIQDGPFAARSQVRRWQIGGDAIELVGDGLPEWLDGTVDTGRIAAGDGRSAIADGGGKPLVVECGIARMETSPIGLSLRFRCVDRSVVSLTHRSSQRDDRRSQFTDGD